jgi:hypothetical protein
VAKIQLGRSPVRKTPEKVVPAAGEVTNGMSMRDIRFCSAITLFSFSSDLCISKACEATLTNLMARLVDLPGERESMGGLAGMAS